MKCIKKKKYQFMLEAFSKPFFYRDCFKTSLSTLLKKEEREMMFLFCTIAMSEREREFKNNGNTN
jgi:hypothetical protein